MSDIDVDPPIELVKQFVLAAHGHLERVQELYQQSPRLLNCKFLDFDENALEAAGHMGRRDIALYLLEQGAHLTVYAAAMLGQATPLQRFLTDYPNLAQKSGVHGFTLLYHAALSGDIEIAELVLANGGTDGKGSALIGAASAGHVEMVQWLLGHQAPTNATNFEGKTAQTVALDTGQAAIVEVLERHRDSIEAESPRAETGRAES